MNQRLTAEEQLNWRGPSGPPRLLHLMAFAALVLVSACVSIPVDQRVQLRSDIVVTADQSLAAFIAEDPALKDEIENAVGYFIGSGTNGPYGLLDRVDAIGVLYDRAEGTRTYLNMDIRNVGPDLPANDLQILVVVKTRGALERLKLARWLSTADGLSVAGIGSRSDRLPADGLSVRMRSLSGAAPGPNVRLARISVNNDLTDAGVSSIEIPNRGSSRSDRQQDDAPRAWNRKLPFLADKVIEKGFDLPLPLGAGMTYVNIEQDMELNNLLVGINGRDKRAFDFVALVNANTDTQSYQFKMDAWVLPFMNVFAMIGKVDGHADLDVLLDGNTLLEGADINCSGIIKPPLCGQLEDQTFMFPVRADVDVTSYGVGTVLAVGWEGWFVTAPLNVTFIDPAGSTSDGFSFTATPRIGRIFSLGNLGNLALFTGTNYLHSEFTLDGIFVVPGELLTFDYEIDQENSEKWNLLLGFHWDINKRWSLSAEYNGFIGSRDALITSFNFRF